MKNNVQPTRNQTDIDYEGIKIPSDADPEDYTYGERRAEILALVKERGSPYAIKKVNLADRYGVSPATITKDFKRLADYVDGNIGKHAKITARAAMEKAVKELQDEGEWAAAFNVAMRWNQWLQSIGEQERVTPEMTVTHREEDVSTDDYEIVSDQAVIEGEVEEVPASDE